MNCCVVGQRRERGALIDSNYTFLQCRISVRRSLAGVRREAGSVARARRSWRSGLWVMPTLARRGRPAAWSGSLHPPSRAWESLAGPGEAAAASGSASAGRCQRGGGTRARCGSARRGTCGTRAPAALRGWRRAPPHARRSRSASGALVAAPATGTLLYNACTRNTSRNQARERQLVPRWPEAVDAAWTPQDQLRCAESAPE